MGLFFPPLLFRTAALALLAVGVAACTRAPQHVPQREALAPSQPAIPVEPEVAAQDEQSVRPDANKQFLTEPVDIDHWLKTFEGESREIAASKDAIAAAVALEEGDEVADVGSGTGLFLALLSAGVGPEGRVYALDISPAFLAHLRERVALEELTNVQVIESTDRSTELPPRSIDVAFVCDTYHHFEFPKTCLGSLRQALRDDGELVIVDFERIPGVSREWVLDHVRCDKDTVIEEIESAGFELVEEIPIEGLKENYFLRFRKE